jgi:hypothetical protein
MSQIVEAKPESVGPLSQRLARIKPCRRRQAARRAGGDRGARPHSILRQGRPERRLGPEAGCRSCSAAHKQKGPGEVAEASLLGPSAGGCLAVRS